MPSRGRGDRGRVSGAFWVMPLKREEFCEGSVMCVVPPPPTVVRQFFL
jgi:hypothetical protein